MKFLLLVTYVTVISQVIESLTYHVCASRRLRSTCVSAQSDQSSQGTLWVAKDPKHH